MDIFKQNLAAISKLDSTFAKKLLNIIPNENLEIFIGKDSADINFLDKQRNTFLFQNNGIEFSINKIDEFNQFALYPYLYCFGLGNGIFYKMLLTNTNLKRLIIIEPNIEIIFSVLNLVNLEKELESNRLFILHSQDVNYENLSPFFYQNKNALMYSKLYNLHIFNDFYDFYLDEASRINKLFVEIIEHGVVSIGNDSKDAIIGIRHHIANIPLMLKTPSLINLIKQAKKTQVAVIVSTGPSLYKQLEILKEIAPYASIFCIDASFPILSKHNIKPDIVLSMERVEESAKFYEESESKYFKDVIFEITSIAHKRLIKAIQDKGGILQISERPFGYTSYFDFNEYGYIGIGMSAANMAYELVVHCGFEKCILIGQDLAFGEDGTSHSKGAVYGENEIKNNKEKIFLPKYGGDGMVKSTKVWKLFWNFFIKDIYETKDRIKVINATEGGARIPGTIEISFRDALKDIDKTKPKELISLSLPNQSQIESNIKKANLKIKELLKYGTNKKEKIEELFLRVVEKTEELEKLNKENNLQFFDFKSLDTIFDEIEKIKGLFRSKKFIDIFNEATQAYIFHQEMELAKIITKQAKDETMQNAKKIEWLFAHKHWLFSLAGCMDSVLFCVKDSFEGWEC